MKALLVTVALAASVVLAGCDQQNDLEVPQIDLSEVDLPDVDWDKYGPEVREEVEGLVQNADCDGLRQELENADADLRRYLESAMDEAGC